MTRRSLPPLAFERVARAILGNQYHLSLVICTDSLARTINRTYRKKTYAANVLSFPLEKREGEMFLNIAAATREAKQFDVSLAARLMMLFIHGCLHLKGLRHTAKMEILERDFFNKYC